MTPDPGTASVRQPELMIIGFPKCGTTALCRHYAQDGDVHLVRLPGGQFEVRLQRLEELRPAVSDKIIAHKFVVNIYHPKVMQQIVALNPESRLVLCIRDPRKSLVSWWAMHQRMARSQTPIDHYVYAERDFYGSCTVAEYYARSAQKALRYDHYFDRLLEMAPADRIVVVGQERLARGLPTVADYLKALARGEAPDPPDPQAADTHRGYADRAGNRLPDEIAAELEAVDARLRHRIAESGVRACL